MLVADLLCSLGKYRFVPPIQSWICLSLGLTLMTESWLLCSGTGFGCLDPNWVSFFEGRTLFGSMKFLIILFLPNFETNVRLCMFLNSFLVKEIGFRERKGSAFSISCSSVTLQGSYHVVEKWYDNQSVLRMDHILFFQYVFFWQSGTFGLSVSLMGGATCEVQKARKHLRNSGISLHWIGDYFLIWLFLGFYA